LKANPLGGSVACLLSLRAARNICDSFAMGVRDLPAGAYPLTFTRQTDGKKISSWAERDALKPNQRKYHISIGEFANFFSWYLTKGSWAENAQSKKNRDVVGEFGIAPRAVVQNSVDNIF
jgi:hypothetical protein